MNRHVEFKSKMGKGVLVMLLVAFVGCLEEHGKLEELFYKP